MKKDNKKISVLDKKILSYMKEADKISFKLGLKVRPVINYKKNKPNFYAKIAMYFLKKSNAFLDTQFISFKK